MLKDGTLAHNVGSGVGVLQAAQEQLLLVERARGVVRDGRGVHQPGTIEKGFTTEKNTPSPNELSLASLVLVILMKLCKQSCAKRFQTGGAR